MTEYLHVLHVFHDPALGAAPANMDLNKSVSSLISCFVSSAHVIACGFFELPLLRHLVDYRTRSPVERMLVLPS